MVLRMKTELILSLCLCLIYLMRSNANAAHSTMDFETTDYEKIVKLPAFIDKSLFIQKFLENNRTTVISTPPGFGKSTCMNMLKRFLEIEVDEEGNPKTKAKYSLNPVKDTSNYKLFADNKLKILEEASTMDEYFGRTPVVSVDFNCYHPIRNFDDALQCFRKTIHDAYKQHKYLIQSERLMSVEKDYISIWCDENSYHMFGKHQVSWSLQELTRFVWRHFLERRVIVLVDDHDQAIRKAMMSSMSDQEVDEIIKYGMTIINTTFRNNSKYVSAGLLTGSMDVPVFHSYNGTLEEPDSYDRCRFLRAHQFSEFFGLVKEEVDDLIERFSSKLSNEVIKIIEPYYSGYISDTGFKLHNLYSTLKCMESGRVENYWVKANPIHNFRKILKVPKVLEIVEKLLKDESVIIPSPEGNLTVEDILEYRRILLKPEEIDERLAMKFLMFCWEEGYLTPTVLTAVYGYQHDVDTRAPVLIPNEEIKRAFTQAIKDNST